MFVIAVRHRIPEGNLLDADALIRDEFDPVLARTPGFVGEMRIFGGVAAGRAIIDVVTTCESEAAVDECHRRLAQLPGWSRLRRLVPDPPEVLVRGEVDGHVVGAIGARVVYDDG